MHSEIIFTFIAACSAVHPYVFGNVANNLGTLPNLWLSNGRLIHSRAYSPFPYLFTALRPRNPERYFQYSPLDGANEKQDQQMQRSANRTEHSGEGPKERLFFSLVNPTTVAPKTQGTLLPVKVINTPLNVTSDSLLKGFSSSLNMLRRNLTKNNKPGVFINNEQLPVSLSQLPLPVSLSDQELSVAVTNDQLPVSVLNTPLEISYPSLLSDIESLLNKFATKLSNNDCPMYFVNETSSICRKMRPGLFDEHLRCICFMEIFETNYSAAESSCILLGLDGIAFKNDVGPNRLGVLRPMRAFMYALGVKTRNFYIANGDECELMDAYEDPSTPDSCGDAHFFICEKILP